MGDPAPVDPPAAAPEVVADGSDGGAGSVSKPGSGDDGGGYDGGDYDLEALPRKSSELLLTTSRSSSRGGCF